MSGMFSRPAPQQVVTAATPAPVVTAPAPMPDSNSAAAIEARRRAQADVMGRAGRSSTILTAPQNRGGRAGDSYSATTLGAGS